MDTTTRIEKALDAALADGEGPGCPPRLAAAVRHSVFPGGARVRPRLCLAVALACGDDAPRLTDAAAAAIELMHCASLVHDDLPCFDDAPMRRGLPSVHVAYGERLAVLAGDALIVLAYRSLALGAVQWLQRLPALMEVLHRGVGMPEGIVAGQAWECESRVALAAYQRAKTGSLFASAAQAGALSAGADPLRWRAFGEWLGEAYQVADDIRDAAADPLEIGKPVGRDVALCRPSSATELGLDGAIAHFQHLMVNAIRSVPQCAGAGALRSLVRAEAQRLVPQLDARELAAVHA